MTFSVGPIFITDGMEIPVSLVRCVSEINLSLDMSCLMDASVTITSARLKNVPKRVGLFTDKSPSAPSHCASDGCAASPEMTEFLNCGESITLRCFENRQGVLLPSNYDQRTKSFPANSPYGEICPYLELQGLYEDVAAQRSGTFTYRFYLGEDCTSDFTLSRNGRYDVIVELTYGGVDELS